MHSDRPGVYEIVDGEAGLLVARERRIPCIKVRITHHASWRQSARKPEHYLASLAAPATTASKASRPTVMLNVAGLIGRLAHPAQPTLAPVLAAMTGYHVGAKKGELRVSSDGHSWARAPSLESLLEDTSAPSLCHCPLEAAVRLERCGRLPEDWKAFPPFDWNRSDGTWARMPGSVLQVAVTAATDAAICKAFEHLEDLVWRLATWGIVIRSRRTVSVTAPASLLAAMRTPFVTKHGVGLVAFFLSMAIRATAKRPEWLAEARSVAAPLSDYPELASAVMGQVLWEHATLVGMEVSKDLKNEDLSGDKLARNLREGLCLTACGKRFADLPSPFRPLLEAYATGVVPLMLGHDRVVVGVPVYVDPDLPWDAGKQAS